MKTTKPAPAAKETPKPVALYAGADAVNVTIPADRCPGVLAFGDMKPGTVYGVAPAEALRLTSADRPTARRFDFASAADAARAADYARAEAAKREAEAKAVADPNTPAAAAAEQE